MNKEVRREALEIPSKAAFERRFLVDGGLPSSKPEIRAPEPPSALLSRLQAFLPALQSANQHLEQAEGEDVKIEQDSEEPGNEGPYVELDLACGLFDLKDEAALTAAERSLTQHGVAVERFGGGSSSSDESDESSSEEESETTGATPMEEEGGGLGSRGGAATATAAAAAAGDRSQGGAGAAEGPQQQGHRQEMLRADVGGPKGVRARARARQRRRRAGIEVIS